MSKCHEAWFDDGLNAYMATMDLKPKKQSKNLFQMLMELQVKGSTDFKKLSKCTNPQSVAVVDLQEDYDKTVYLYRKTFPNEKL